MGMPISEAESEEISQFFEDKELWETMLPVETTYFGWFCMLGNLQLALRYPENTGVSADLVRGMAKRLAERLMEDIPAIDAEFVKKAGWQEFGIEVDEPE